MDRTHYNSTCTQVGVQCLFEPIEMSNPANVDQLGFLGGEKITQVDVSKGTDGKLLLICTPDDFNYDLNDYNHKGCKVVEIKSLENSTLERDNSGKLRIWASITASDSNKLGSGASAYDPNSETGILFTKRIKTQL